MGKDTARPDESLANADWPKRTPDRLSDIEALIKKEDEQAAKRKAASKEP